MIIEQTHIPHKYRNKRLQQNQATTNVGDTILNGIIESSSNFEIPDILEDMTYVGSSEVEAERITTEYLYADEVRTKYDWAAEERTRNMQQTINKTCNTLRQIKYNTMRKLR